MVKKYNEIEVKNNMQVGNDTDEVAVVEEREKLQKLVNVQPKKAKKGLIGRLVTGILGPDGLPGIGSYVNDEIVKPAIKNIIVDAVTSGINMVMYGDKAPRNNRGSYTSYSQNRTTYRPGTNYANRYTSQSPDPQERRIAHSPKHGVEEYIIEERFDAAHVLTTLTESADRYDTVSVADYYDLIGVPSQYTDNTYGWTIDSISRASIVPVRGGYVIKFPPTEVI